METIYDLVKRAEKNYVNNPVKHSKYVDYDMYEIIETINAYSNSRHISGKYDALGREKPFFNIVTAAINVWYKATDIDRKNIRFKASNSSTYIKAFIASILLRDWMNRNRFGQYLNKWGRTLAKFGSAISKILEKNGQLFTEVISWDRIICDPVSFQDNIKIEKLYFTPSQLRKIKEYDQEKVEEIISKSKETRKTIDNQVKDLRNDYIGIYEVHGEFPLSFLTDKEEDEKEFRQQMHVIFINGKTGKNEIKSTLYRGKEEKDPYSIAHLIEEDGRTLSIGAVEYLFDAQWMANHSVKQIKDQLDLASKMILQTADEQFVGKNVLTNLETGDILFHAENKPLTQVNNQSHDTPAITNYLIQWQNLARDITGTPESITGETMPSGTAYRQVAILNKEAHSLFEIMTENKGLYLENILRDYIIPYFKKKLNNSDEIALILEANEIEKLDNFSLPANLEQELKNKILFEGNKELPPIEQLTQEVQERQKQFGQTRFIKPSKKEKKTWAEYFKDFEWDVEIEITPENTDKEATLSTLSTILQTIASNPNILQDENAKLIFSKILEETGRISPVELKSITKPIMAQQPQGQSVGMLGEEKIGGKI